MRHTKSGVRRPREAGFTLIELMIVIAIIGILAAVAVPQFGQYTKRSKFTEVISVATTAKTSMSVCLQTTSTPAGCDTWVKLGIDPNALTQPPSIASAVIESAPMRLKFVASADLNSATYELTPSYDPASSTIVWQTGGTCRDAATRYC